ncbi:putative GNAT family acetyltransferase [Stackebrandtia albiflava]|uniref:Putative GNAT family acetyltransferase n=1 Tax=Stackebrandtia albiflava TaxID=406432 RepID=A0A562V9W2_9ACTN|nr:GNAT family N-acetyltransferase [Stackebrandtia albiflava]TWJ14607.1 putative GNAT family acetyltransferase [Stackebrandtia albiflava]
MEDTTTVRRHDTPGEFVAAVADWLTGDPVGTNVLATVAHGRALGMTPRADGEFWLTVHDTTGVTGAALQSGRGLLLPRLPDSAVDALARELAAWRPGLSSVNGPRPAVERFVARWRERTGRAAEVTGRTGLLAMAEPSVPDDVPGGMRTGTADDADTVVGWTRAFAESVHDGERIGLRQAADAFHRMRAAGVVYRLWQVEGIPVSMMYESLPVNGVVRIQNVYTPPARRGNGYAAALVGTAARDLTATPGLTACVLYVDRANPTAAGIYRRVGFRPYLDAVAYRFTGLPVPAGSTPMWRVRRSSCGATTGSAGSGWYAGSEWG